MTDSSAAAAGTFALGGDLSVNRLGYGAMRLTGPGIFGPPRDWPTAIAILRCAVERGVNHIDTSDYYGPHIVNELIAEALHPYPRDLVLVTKVGARRDEHGGWHEALSPAELTSAVHDNLRHLKLDRLDVVNLRLPGPDAAVAEPYETLAALREQGLIRHLGLSNVSAAQYAEARAIAPFVCVQNEYSLADRADDPMIDACAADEVAYVPFFPLANLTPGVRDRLSTVAGRHGVSWSRVALAWLLRRSPNMLCIPGTSTLAHLDDNVAAASLRLSEEDAAELSDVDVPA